MNLFIAGYGETPVDEDLPRAALEGLVADWPFFDPGAIQTWSSRSQSAVIAAVSHAAAVLGGVRYSSFEDDRAALFAGRPVLVAADGPSDGAGALDPARYHAPAERWAQRLDGRCTVVRADDTVLEVYTDPLGAYPMFEARAHGKRWFSNSAEALRRLAGDSAIDEAAMASMLAGGWSLGGDPVWRAVRRVDRGVVLTLRRDGETRRELLSLESMIGLFGAGLDVPVAARQLVDLTAAMAQWPGRPNVVPVTGGRDSRLVLAAALGAGFEFDALTGGAVHDPDVVVAAALCATVGIPHGLLGPDPYGDRFSDLPRAALMTALSSSGTATLADAAGFPLGPREGPMPVWHSGQGGEMARAYFGLGSDHVVDKLYAKFSGRRPGRTGVVSDEAGQLLRGRIDALVTRAVDAGARMTDVPDVFYILERTICWAAPTHAVVEVIRDNTSPLWCKTMLPHMLGLPARERALDGFHYEVLRELAPQLVDERFQDGSTWPSRQRDWARRAQRTLRLAGKVNGELRRRIARYRAGARAGATPDRRVRSRSDPVSDPFEAVMAAVREAAFSQPQHPAWSVLDRRRVEVLLASPPVSLDEMSRYYVWRLASAFIAPM